MIDHRPEGTSGAAGVAGAAPGAMVRLTRMLQFGDSMFPIGSFAFSNGLESAIQKNVVHDADTLEAYTRTAVEQAALGDGIALIHAHRAARAKDLDAAANVDDWVLARKLSSEARTMTVRTGKKLAESAVQITQASLLTDWLERIKEGATPGSYPVTLALVFAAQGLDAREAFIVHQYGVGANILSAALRLMKIGHLDTQRMLYEINADIEAAWENAAAAELEDMAGFAPLTDILAAVHVQTYVRLFMS